MRIFSSPGASAAVPVWSVIVCGRNHRGYLGELVDALLDQDETVAVEVIICDDASTDGSGDLLETMAARPLGRHPGPRELHVVRLAENVGPAAGRNVGIGLARGRLVAFTDSDCRPRRGWLRAAREALEAPGVGVVQGRTLAAEHPVPLFEHHIDIDHLDGTFATANVAYRRDALDGFRFDPACWTPKWTWEDADLGWKVMSAGWRAAFAANAVVEHRVIRIGARAWLLWPRRIVAVPALTLRHPAYRRHLFLGLWARPVHLWLELALVGLVLATRWLPALALAAPYVLMFARSRGLRGRFPPAKAAAYVAADLISVSSVLWASARHRAVVL